MEVERILVSQIFWMSKFQISRSVIFEENIEEFREVRGQVESYLKYINAGALKIIYKIMKKKLNFKYRFANKVNFID